MHVLVIAIVCFRALAYGPNLARNAVIVLTLPMYGPMTMDLVVL